MYAAFDFLLIVDEQIGTRTSGKTKTSWRDLQHGRNAKFRSGSLRLDVDGSVTTINTKVAISFFFYPKYELDRSPAAVLRRPRAAALPSAEAASAMTVIGRQTVPTVR